MGEAEGSWAGLPSPVAFVLGGGASSAAVEVGMFQAISEAGLRPDLVVGTSSGALNGAVIALDPAHAVERLREIWSGLDRTALLRDSMFDRARNVTRRGRLFSDDGLSDLYDKYFPDVDIGSLEVPFAAVATDLGTGDAAVLHRGPLRSALLASSAIPGVFPLVERDGAQLCDGGLVANVPVRQAIELGAGSIVVLECGARRMALSESPALVRTVLASVAVTLGHQARTDLDYARDRVPVVHLPGQSPEHLSSFDFSQTDHLIARAYELSRAHLDELRSGT